ncbi:MAG: hypothetical protein ACI8UG_002633, partial [Gammaproteobacteria bacterium]
MEVGSTSHQRLYIVEDARLLKLLYFVDNLP